MRPPALITALKEAGVLSEDAVTAPDAVLDLDTAEMIVGDLGHNTRILQGHIRDATMRPLPKDESLLKPRAPVVTIMGKCVEIKITTAQRSIVCNVYRAWSLLEMILLGGTLLVREK